MSREKPALDLLRCIEIAWSAYDRIGERMRNTGAAKPVTVVRTLPIASRVYTKWRLYRGRGRVKRKMSDVPEDDGTGRISLSISKWTKLCNQLILSRARILSKKSRT